MRILFLAQYLDSGGVTTHMMTLAKGLMPRGHEVALASHGQLQNHSHGPSWFEANGIKHYFVPFPGIRLGVRNIGCALNSLLATLSAAREFRPDLLHVHFRSTSPYAQAIRLRYGIPFVTTLHLDQIPSSTVFRMLSFWGERAIAISRETRDYLEHEFGVPSNKIRVIYNGVDEQYFRPPTERERMQARQELGVRAEDYVASLIGRLERVKGHDVLINPWLSCGRWG